MNDMAVPTQNARQGDHVGLLRRPKHVTLRCVSRASAPAAARNDVSTIVSSAAVAQPPPFVGEKRTRTS